MTLEGQDRDPDIFGCNYPEERQRKHWKDCVFFEHYLAFEVNPTYVTTVPQRHRQTDRQTDKLPWLSNTALCAASRGKNWNDKAEGIEKILAMCRGRFHTIPECF